MTRTLLRALAVCAILAGANLPFSSSTPSPTPAQAAPVNPGYVGKVRWGYYVPYATDSLESVKQNIRSLTHLSPYWYQIDGNGRLINGETKANAGERATVLDLARKNGVRVLPMIKNSDQYETFHATLADPGTRQQAVAAIVQMVVDTGVDGAHIDFEGLSPEDRPNLTQFMADLAPALRAKGKLVTQAVAARDRDRDTGWAGAYDYAALAPYNDFIVTMTYGYGTAVPQSTAPYTWVANSAAYAISQIPREKLLLGLAWYGYQWNLTSGSVKALRYSDAMDIAAKNGVQVGFDEASQTAKFSYTAGGENFEVWFEDGRASDAKLDLVFRLGLAGAAGWRMGHEDPSAVASFRTRLGYQTWYLAEGSTVKPFDTWILIQNPNTTPVNAKVTFFKEDGTTAAYTYPVAPSSRFSLYANAVLPDSSFSTKVEADAPILVERAMYFGIDGHDSVGLNAPSRTWYLPDGSSRDGGDTWLLLMNPNPAPVNARVSFLREDGLAPIVKEFTLKATSRLNVYADDQVPNARFSMVVETDRPVVAERASYFASSKVGDGKPGTWFLARRWYTAEGFTGHTVSLVVMNPGAVQAQTTLTFMLEDGSTVKKDLTVPAKGRATFVTNDVLPANTAFSTQIDADQPIAVERTSVLPDGGRGRAVHSSLAVTGPSRTWYLAEGSTSAPFSTFILLQNPNATATQVTVTFMTDSGQVVPVSYTLGPKSRFTVLANSVVPNAALSTRVDSEQPIVVERTMYFRDGATSSMGVLQ